MRVHRTLSERLARYALKSLAACALVLLTTVAVQLFLGSRAHAAQSSAKVACLNFDTSQPEAFDIQVGDNIGGAETFEGGYPVFTCLGGQDLAIAPNAPPDTLHTITASCPTAPAVIEQKSTKFGEETVRYVVARCNPAGETLTLTVADPPGTKTQHAGTYPHTPNATTCPPDCGFDPQPDTGNPDRPPGTEICEIREQHLGGDPKFDEKGCIDELKTKKANPPLFMEAVEYVCTNSIVQMPGNNTKELAAREKALEECKKQEYTRAGVTVGESKDANVEFNCAVSVLNPLTWFMCPMVEGLQTLINRLDSGITSFLTIKDSNFDTSCADKGVDKCPGAGFYAAWSSLRTIALVLLVIIGLIMVISQALSFGPIDAYTVKKVLPRIFFAVILISLSWPLMRWFVNFTNDLGGAVRGIIVAPFGGGNITLGGGATSAGATALVGAGLALGIVGFLSLAATAALAVIIAFALLLFRQMLITMLVVLAPIAIVMYILPNTQKFWKLWWESFSKALLMFPILSAFIAAGRVFAKVVVVGDNDVIHQLFAFGAYFAPYFLIPATFRLAGGALATIGGMANDRSRGVFDRLKKGRQERMGNRIKEFRNAGLYNEQGGKSKRAVFGNKLGGWVFNADDRLPMALGGAKSPLGGAGRKMFGNRAQVLMSKIDHAKMEQTEKLAQGWNKMGMNDKGARAISGSFGKRGEVFEAPVWDALQADLGFDDTGYLKGGLQTQAQFMAASKHLQTSTDQTTRKGGSAIARAMPQALNLRRQGEGYANIAGAAGMILSSHGFGTEDDLVNIAKNVRESGGGQHFAEEMGVQMELLGKGGLLKAGYSLTQDETGEFVSGMTADNAKDWALVGSLGVGDWAGAKSGAAGRKMEVLREMVEYSRADDAGKAQLEYKWKNEQGHSDATITSRRNLAEANKDVAIGTLVQLASQYSPAPGDTKVKATKALEYLNLQDLVQSFDANATPEQRAEMARIAQQNAATNAANPLKPTGDIGGTADTSGTANI